MRPPDNSGCMALIEPTLQPLTCKPIPALTPHPSAHYYTSLAQDALPQTPLSPLARRLYQPVEPEDPTSDHLSNRAKSRVHLAISHSFADSTATSYAQSVKKFLAFCSREHTPKDKCWPADEPTLCA